MELSPSLQDLLPHYERELAKLAALAGEMGQRYPGMPAHLSVVDELLQDPQVDRLMQAAALLSARVHHRLEDNHPELPRALLDRLYPHYLRPWPACAIACFEDKDAARRTTASVLARGLEIQAPSKSAGLSTFRTTSALQMLPFRVAFAGFRATARAPEGVRLPSRARSILSLRLELLSRQGRWSDLDVPTIRLYLDGDRALVACLRETLVSRVLATAVQTSDTHAWAVDTQALPRSVGFDAGDALLDEGCPGASPVYRQLAEYFAFPEKFNFIDIPLPAAVQGCAQASLTLHFALGASLRGANGMAVLERVNADNLRLGCAPVINLFEVNAAVDASSLEEGRSGTVSVDAALPAGCEVYAIRRVFRAQEGPLGPTETVFPPYFGLRHGHADTASAHSDEPAAYWLAHRSQGEGTRAGRTDIVFVDLDGQPVDLDGKGLGCDLLAINFDPSARIDIGKPEGDFSPDAQGLWERVRFLTPPTPPRRFDLQGDRLWRLVSQLSLNVLLLSGRGVDALRDILGRHDLAGRADHRALREAMRAIDYQTVAALLEFDGASSVERGTRIVLALDDEAVSSADLHLFGEVLSRLLARCVHRNSFTRLALVSARTGDDLIPSVDRRGEKDLL